MNRERGKLTDKISPSGRLIQSSTDSLGGAMATEKIGTQQIVPDETTVLDFGNETTLLSGEFENEDNETTVLIQTDIPNNVFETEYEITYIHTSEIITMEVK